MMRFLSTLLTVAGTAWALVSPDSAVACPVSEAYVAIIHDALPTPLPAGTFVAEVSIDDGNPDALFTSGVRARVLRRVQGADRGGVILLRKRSESSCSHPFDNGRRGFIVAVARGYQGGLLVVDPIEVSRRADHRLPDGYIVPEAFRTDSFDLEYEAIVRFNRPQE